MRSEKVTAQIERKLGIKKMQMITSHTQYNEKGWYDKKGWINMVEVQGQNNGNGS